jgi:hypothetical protein
MTGATQQDAMVLLKLSEIAAIRGMPNPLNWLSSAEYDRSYAAFRRKYPPGAEMYETAMTIVQHFDAMAVLWKHGLVDEDLLFDYSPVELVWERIQGFVLGVRDELKAPMFGAHFEMMARSVVGIEAVGVEQREFVPDPIG